MIRRLAFIALALALPLAAAEKKPSDKKTDKKPSKSKAKGEDKKAAALPYEVAEFIEPDFPYFSSTLDARDVGGDAPKDNLTPRGLILNLGHNLWACYDVDLLRVACIWEAEPGKPPISLVALAPRSYKDPGQKTKDGQEDLPKPQGKILLTNGIYPGWQVGETFVANDPRDPCPTPSEVGRGPLAVGHFKSIRSTKAGIEIESEVAGVKVTETFSSVLQDGQFSVVHRLRVGATKQPLVHANGHMPATAQPKSLLPSTAPGSNDPAVRRVSVSPQDDPFQAVVKFKASDADQVVEVSFRADADGDAGQTATTDQTDRWPQVFTTQANVSKDNNEAYVFDDIALPTTNPWKRNVRLADIAFLDDQGHAAGVTMDGDVWLISGLKGNLENITWKRYTSGFHEPMNIVWRPSAGDGRSEIGDRAKASSSPGEALSTPSAISHLPSPVGDLLVYDRNGIWKLVDSKGTGEADVHEMFCNLFSQTGETREFPNSMKLAGDGSLYICKGGQQGTTLGKDNGKVLHIAADGKSYKAVAWGLRQPFIGVNEKTGLVTASDQQGNYVPSTPLHIIRDNQYYGFLTEQQPKEEYPATIADPLTWIPHPVNPSGATQVWLNNAKMGPLNDTMLHLAYSRADIFTVLFDDRQKKPQAAVCNIPLPIPFPPTNGHVNPADGQLYLVGFQIWGTTAQRVAGLGRVRYTGAPCVLPNALSAMDKGILVRFDSPVDKAQATNPDNWSVERWNYKRTWDYGSAHYKLDGNTGQEIIPASATYVSEDGRSVFVAVPDMKKCDQMHLGWNLKSADGRPMQHNAYFTPWNFSSFDPAKEGFGNITVNLTPRVVVVKEVKPTVEEGKRLYQFIGCMGCHSVDGSVAGRLGPSWKGLFGSIRILSDDTRQLADEAYIRESILEPSKKKAKAYLKLETGMPIYAGILSDSQIESIILYMKTLGPPREASEK